MLIVKIRCLPPCHAAFRFRHAADGCHTPLFRTMLLFLSLRYAAYADGRLFFAIAIC